jgi:uncharacterized protein YcaQ
MAAETLSLADARRLAVCAQLLDGQRHGLPSGKAGAAETIEWLGYVQIDTIAVVRRAHHHVLWARCPEYDASMLHELQASDRRVFEYWAHAMAYLPMSDYRYYVPRMNRIRAEGTPWMREWRAKYPDVLDEVLARIRAEGPLTSKDFEPPPGTKRGTWWDWKPAKRALELLFWQGDLMIAERRAFQKVYDLTERVLPPDVDSSPPSDAECARFQVRRALRALGAACEREIREYGKLATKPRLAAALDELIDAGEVVRVRVGGSATGDFALVESLEALDGRPIDSNVHLLSPFDGLIIQRPRVRRLFDFDYTIECYVPEAKRKYGYFVLPILYGDRLVGRLDPKADRKAGRLVVRKLWLEKGFEADETFLERLGERIAQFAVFNECDSVIVEKASPAKLRGPASRCARAAMKAARDRMR